MSQPSLSASFGFGPDSRKSVMERAMGIEPTSEAWEASILPLYDARSRLTLPNPPRSCKNSMAFISC